MLKVLRYEVEHGEFALTLPEGAKVLPTFQRTTRGLRMYVLADVDAPETDERSFVLIERDEELPVESADSVSYIATHKVYGAETLHLFELVGVTA